jgi:hypothetical protein
LNKRFDLAVAQFENVAAKPPKPALAAAPHSLGGAGASGLDLFGYRACGLRRHQGTPIDRILQ